MQIPVLRGVIERRMLVNYRVDPSVLARLLPAPFRPKVVHGVGLAGICLIRLAKVRPAFLPGWWGIGSENAAHRIAVEWSENGVTRQGVFIPRRDTSSRLNAFAGGRLFPGVHHLARFQVEETEDDFHVALRAEDDGLRLDVRARQVARLPASSVFPSLEEASAFFAAGSVGYSVTRDPQRFHGLELRCRTWQVEPLEVEAVQSSFFDDPMRFPSGSLELDCALLMRNIEHEWHGLGELVCCAGPLAA